MYIFPQKVIKNGADHGGVPVPGGQPPLDPPQPHSGRLPQVQE